MALSRIVMYGDGSTTQYAIPFALGYINESDISCYVGNETISRDLTFLGTTLVEIGGTVPASGERILFERTVAQDRLLVDYIDGDIINEENMNTSQKQTMMLVHQVLDGRFAQFQSDTDLGGFRFKNMGEPEDAQDAATKNYVDARITSNQSAVNAAAASALSAASSASAAAASASSANTSATAAAAYEGNANKWAQEAENIAVNDGTHTGYSAYHWAKKAEIAAGGGVMSIGSLTGTVTVAALKSELDITGVTAAVVTAKAAADLNNVSQSVARTKVGAGTMAYRDVTISTSAPSGGADGDIWLQYE